MSEHHSEFATLGQLPPADFDPPASRSPGDEVVAFLSTIRGTHLLVAIDPSADPKKKRPTDIEGLTCNMTVDSDKVRGWVNDRNGHKNLHWTVNEVRPNFFGNKATKQDIIRARFAHLDVDVAGENSAQALRALLDQINEHLPKGLDPSVVIASGGGYQLLFALTEELTRGANDDQVRLAVEAQNRGLIELLGGDAATWNLDRLLRLPGTQNIPNAKKRAIGRVRRGAELVTTCASDYSLAALASFVPPISIEEKVSAEPAIAKVWAELEDRFHEQCCQENDLPEELRAKLARALDSGTTKFRDFWKNGTEATAGRKSALASFLGWRDLDFSAEEYAQLMWCWGFQHEGPDYCDANLSPRSLARAYVNTYLDKIPMREERDAQSAAGIVVGDVYEHLSDDKAGNVPGLLTVTGPIDATAIPRRVWLIHPRLPIGDASQIVGEPGVSKSSHTLNDALAVATENEAMLRGPNNVGFDQLLNAGPVLIYNAEDWIDDMRRRLKVLMDHHGVTELKHPIHLLSGVEAAPLIVMERKTSGMPLTRAPGSAVLEAYIKRHGIKLAVLDPQISLARGANENDTDDMNDILQELAQIAARSLCAVVTVQHTAKSTRNAAGDMGAARGAFSQVGKIRSGYTLVKVDPADAVKWGFSPTEKLVRMDYSKNNHAAVPDTPVLYRRRSGQVGNGTGYFQNDGAPFAENSAARFAREGDSAPFLENVGLGVSVGDFADGAQPVASPTDMKRQTVAHAALAELAGRDQMALSAAWPGIGRVLVEAKMTKASSRQSITHLVTLWLAGSGEVVDQDGQNVRIWLEKEGMGPTASWILRAEREELASLASLAKESVFA